MIRGSDALNSASFGAWTRGMQAQLLDTCPRNAPRIRILTDVREEEIMFDWR